MVMFTYSMGMWWVWGGGGGWGGGGQVKKKARVGQTATSKTPGGEIYKKKSYREEKRPGKPWEDVISLEFKANRDQ